MNKNNHGSAIKIIATTLNKDEQGVRELLRRNGVDTTLVRGKRQLTKVFMNAMAKSDQFTKDFIDFVENKKKKGWNNLVDPSNDYGLDYSISIPSLGGGSSSSSSSTFDTNNPMFNPNTSISDLANTGAESTTGEQTSTTGTNSGGFFSGVNFTDLLNSGIKILELQKDIKVSDNEKDTITKAVQIKQEEQNLSPKPSGGNKWMWVWIGVGVLFVGGLTYYAIKKGK